LRPASAAYDRQFQIATLDEIAALVRDRGGKAGGRSASSPSSSTPLISTASDCRSTGRCWPRWTDRSARTKRG
jgi:hypothetical protein